MQALQCANVSGTHTGEGTGKGEMRLQARNRCNAFDSIAVQMRLEVTLVHAHYRWLLHMRVTCEGLAVACVQRRQCALDVCYVHRRDKAVHRVHLLLLTWRHQSQAWMLQRSDRV